MADSPVVVRVTQIVMPILDDLGCLLYDCEFAGGTLRITIDNPGGLDVDTLSLASRLIGRELDHEDPVPGHYNLEVSSPGLERNLRTPEHYRGAVGTEISVRLRHVVDGARRRSGILTAADDSTITLATDSGEASISYGDVDRARTIFRWGTPSATHTRTKETTGS